MIGHPRLFLNLLLWQRCRNCSPMCCVSSNGESFPRKLAISCREIQRLSGAFLFRSVRIAWNMCIARAVCVASGFLRVMSIFCFLNAPSCLAMYCANCARCEVLRVVQNVRVVRIVRSVRVVAFCDLHKLSKLCELCEL